MGNAAIGGGWYLESLEESEVNYSLVSLVINNSGSHDSYCRRTETTAMNRNAVEKIKPPIAFSLFIVKEIKMFKMLSKTCRIQYRVI